MDQTASRLVDLLAPVSPDLERLSTFLASLGKADGEYLHHVIQTLLERHRNPHTDGLALLVARTVSGEVPEVVVQFAAAVQLLGVAGLAHRHMAPASSLIPAEQPIIDLHLVVLAGDYLYSQAAVITAELHNLVVMGLLSREIMQQCLGELARQRGEAVAGASGGLYALCVIGTARLLGCDGPLMADLTAFGEALNLTESSVLAGSASYPDLASLLPHVSNQDMRSRLLALARTLAQAVDDSRSVSVAGPESPDQAASVRLAGDDLSRIGAGMQQKRLQE